MKKKGIAFLLVMVVAVGALFVGFKNKDGVVTEVAEAAEFGSLILKVNPEIKVSYDEKGIVTKVDGLNEDGVKLLKNEKDYIGKSSKKVIEDLIVKIKEAGYFIEEIEGENRKITLEIKPGSELPNDKFLEEIAKGVKDLTKSMDLNSKVVGVSKDDYNKAKITAAKAKEIALKHAGLTESDVKFVKVELDYDDGRLEYEIEFYKGNVEYDYEIDAMSGKILEFDKEIDDIDYKKIKNQNKVNNNNKYIGMNKAIDIALKHAGKNIKDVRFDDKEFDKDDGRASYEIEFKSGGVEYEYDIDAITGEIIKFEKDTKDVVVKPSQPKKTEVKTQVKENKIDTDYSDYTDYDDTDYDDTDYDDTDYDDTDYSDYDDTDYDD